MRALLVPNRNSAYGQDFLDAAIAERCSLTPVVSTPANFTMLGGASLVVSQNPDTAEDALLIESLYKDVPVAIHVHCQHTYYSKEQRECIERCAARARIGVTPADFTTRDMRVRYPKVIWHTVHNGIDTRRYLPTSASERIEWRNHRGIPADRPLVAFVGRLERAKGLDILREFCTLSADAGVAVLVQFLATGEAAVFQRYREAARKLSAMSPGNIFPFPDTDLRSDRPIRYCDALLVPSLSEVAPLVALEAFHSGIPVIGTRCTPFYEEILSLGIGNEDCMLVDVSRSVDLTLERSRLAMDSDTAHRIAGQLLEFAAGFPLRTDLKRRETSERTRATTLTLDSMLSNLADLYRNAT